MVDVYSFSICRRLLGRWLFENGVYVDSSSDHDLDIDFDFDHDLDPDTDHDLDSDIDPDTDLDPDPDFDFDICLDFDSDNDFDHDRSNPVLRIAAVILCFLVIVNFSVYQNTRTVTITRERRSLALSLF